MNMFARILHVRQKTCPLFYIRTDGNNCGTERAENETSVQIKQEIRVTNITVSTVQMKEFGWKPADQQVPWPKLLPPHREARLPFATKQAHWNLRQLYIVRLSENCMKNS